MIPNTILKVFKSRTGIDPLAKQLLTQLRHDGYPGLEDVKIEHVLRVEGITESDLAKLQPLFAQPVIERAGIESIFKPSDHVIEISYQRAVTDPELDSIQHGADSLGINSLLWARLSTRYQFCGVDDRTADEIAKRYRFNAQVQSFITSEWSTLIPQGLTGGVEELALGEMDLAQLRKLSDARRLFLSDLKLGAIQAFFRDIENRPARDAELEMITAAWSDHCSHESWKTLGLFQALQDATAQINHPLVVSAFIDNSGVMKFYDGWAINFKGETHISPTFGGSPFGGVMTKHGGVIRDIIFTGLGAYPIAGTTIMATCDPRIPWEAVPPGAFHPATVVKESIRGTLEYCNPMGIPMSWSKYLIHPNNWKGLALGHSIGILPEKSAKKGEPKPGDFVVLIGGPTGIDGIHGATVSSSSMTSETSTRDAAHVQIGMPIEERKFMEAIPKLRDAGCIRAGTDCGAAGLSSAGGEMGSACGIWINLSWVPRKCADMKPWEIWLSESQERGLLAVPPDKLEIALAILESYGVPAAFIGIFTSTNRCQVVMDEEADPGIWTIIKSIKMSGIVVVDLPYSFLTAGCPLPVVSMREPERKISKFSLKVPENETEWTNLVQQVLGHYNICDQSAAAHQFDQSVQGKTVLTYVSGPGERMPDELSVRAPIFGKKYGQGNANAVNQFYGEVNPAMFGRLMLASATAKLVAAGFAPGDINFCANVYSPPVLEDPENAWALTQLVRHGYAPGTVEIGIPVTSGKDSSSGRFKNEKTGQKTDAPLTLDVLAIGRMPDVRKLIRKPFRTEGDLIFLYSPGLIKAHLGGSVLYDLFGQRGDELTKVDLRSLRKGLEAYHKFRSLIHSRSAIAEGGLIRRLFECCYGSGLGCEIHLPSFADPLHYLFAELHGSILFTSTSDSWTTQIDSPDYHFLGVVTGSPAITVKQKNLPLFSCPIVELGKAWGATFAEVIQ